MAAAHWTARSTMTGTSGNQSHAKSACATAAPLCATRWSARTQPTAPTQWFPTTSAAPSAQTTVRRLDSHAPFFFSLPYLGQTEQPHIPHFKCMGKFLWIHNIYTLGFLNVIFKLPALWSFTGLIFRLVLGLVGLNQGQGLKSNWGKPETQLLGWLLIRIDKRHLFNFCFCMVLIFLFLFLNCIDFQEPSVEVNVALLLSVYIAISFQFIASQKNLVKWPVLMLQ